MVPTSRRRPFIWFGRYPSTSEPDVVDESVATDEPVSANSQLASLQYCTPSGVEQDS